MKDVWNVDKKIEKIKAEIDRNLLKIVSGEIGPNKFMFIYENILSRLNPKQRQIVRRYYYERMGKILLDKLEKSLR